MDRKFLRQQRGTNELEVRRLFREGVIQRDKRGYFAYEVLEDWEIDLGEEENKFYIEETYQFLEDQICGLYQAGEELQAKFEQLDAKKDFWEIQNIIYELLMTDIKLILLHSLHQGWELEGLFSIRQAKKWFESQIEERSFSELFNELLASQTESPLGVMRHFSRVMGDLMEGNHFNQYVPQKREGRAISG